MAKSEIEVVGTCSGKRIELRELAAYALHQWPDGHREGAPAKNVFALDEFPGTR